MTTKKAIIDSANMPQDPPTRQAQTPVETEASRRRKVEIMLGVGSTDSGPPQTPTTSTVLPQGFVHGVAVGPSQEFPQAVRRSERKYANHHGCHGIHGKKLIQSGPDCLHNVFTEENGDDGRQDSKSRSFALSVSVCLCAKAKERNQIHFCCREHSVVRERSLSSSLDCSTVVTHYTN